MPSFFVLGLEDGHVPNFLASTANAEHARPLVAIVTEFQTDIQESLLSTCTSQNPV